MTWDGQPGDAMKRLKEELPEEDFREQAALYWADHRDEALVLFRKEWWKYQVEHMDIPRRAKKLLLKYGTFGVVDGVIQGWLIFELVTSDGAPLNIIEEFAEAIDLTLDVEDFELRMEEFREKSRAGKKPGLQEWNEEKHA